MSLAVESSEIKVIKITGKGVGDIELYIASCQVSSRARMIKHPVESGGQIFDNKVIDPRMITIQASVYADDTLTKESLRKMWRNRTYQFYEVSTREATYKNLSCTDCSHTENTEKLDMLEYTIRFEEVLMPQTRTSTASPDDANVVK